MKTPDMTVSLVQKKQNASRPGEASGLLRELLSVEWKLFRRNRRTRMMLIFFAVVSLFAIFDVILIKDFDIIVLSYVLNAMIIYIACGFGLRGSFYDGLLSRPVSQVMIVLLLILAMVVPLIFIALFPVTNRVVFPTMGVLGLAGLLFHAGWVRLITRSLEKRRYEFLERFRVSRRRVCSP